MSHSVWTLTLLDEAATLRLAGQMVNDLMSGDLVTLSGDLGVGKTTFARALIRAALEEPEAEIPSPTYTILQSYDGPRGRIIHADLYRIAEPSELAELGWDETAEDSIVLVEWAEKAGDALAGDRLDIRLALVPGQPQARYATLTGYGSFAARLQRLKSIRHLLDGAGFGAAKRVFMQGDASARAYEQIVLPDRQAILMISPRKPDGPPIRLGKPYSAIAKLATSVESFVAMALGLRNLGYSAPDILAADLQAGLLLVEDLGRQGVIDDNGPVEAHYALAIDVLADLHGRDLPDQLPVPGAAPYTIPRFDLDAFGIEAELLLDWYCPYAMNRAAHASMRLSFIDAWNSVLEPVLAGEKTWVLRDYHSPNLIVIPDREGLQAMGMIDFQDCVIGPTAYDVASLLQDARVSVPEAMEVSLLARYVRRRLAQDQAFDIGAFTSAYAIMGAQRATKILGIFVRLDRRDGKPGYLKHLARIEAYLKRCLAHPALAKLDEWYAAHLPDLSGRGANKDVSADADRTGDGSGGGAGDADAPADTDMPQTPHRGGRDEPSRS